MTAIFLFVLQLGLAAPTGGDLRLDVDGDGRTDRVHETVADGSVWLDVWGGDGDAATLRSTTRIGAVPARGCERWLPLDVDGDGRTDLVRLLPCDGRTLVEVWRATPDGFSLAARLGRPAALARMAPVVAHRPLGRRAPTLDDRP